MLITSLVVSLNQLLPIAILLVLLQVFAKQSAHHIWICLMVGVAMSFLYMYCALWASQWFDHKGLEYIQIAMCIAIFIAVLVFVIQQSVTAFNFAIITTIVMYLSHYVIYLNSFWKNSDAAESLFIGTFLGSGICLSFCVLLYFFMSGVKHRFGNYPILILIALNSASKLLVALDLASQIDLITNTNPIWDLRHWISEHSELGRVLRALIGYEATPDLTTVLTYIASTALFLIFFYVIPASISKERV